jgi:hypothetical protein
MVEHMDEVLAAALAMPDPTVFLHRGDHAIDDIYEVPRTPGSDDLSLPAGVN